MTIDSPEASIPNALEQAARAIRNTRLEVDLPDNFVSANDLQQAVSAAKIVVQYLARCAHDVAWQAGVGGMETAGSIVSYLAIHPDKIEAFLKDGSVIDWPSRWHVEGCLSWHGQDGGIYRPSDVPSPARAATTAATELGVGFQPASAIGNAKTPKPQEEGASNG